MTAKKLKTNIIVRCDLGAPVRTRLYPLHLCPYLCRYPLFLSVPTPRPYPRLCPSDPFSYPCRKYQIRPVRTQIETL